MLGEKIVESIVKRYIKLIPIIKSRALELGVIDLKSKRTYEMKGSTRSGAGAGNISRILWNSGSHRTIFIRDIYTDLIKT